MATTVYGNLIQLNGTSSGWRSFLAYSESVTSTSYTIDCYGGFGSHICGFSMNYAIASTLYLNGQSVASVANQSVHLGSGATVDLKMVPSNGTSTFTFERTKSTQTITLSCKTVSDSSFLPGTSTASTTITIPAIDSYTVSYNANGGTNAPSSQTKYNDEDLTLTTDVPTRDDYNFLGWSTSASATSATYSPGSTYSVNADCTLYAVWQLAYQAPRIIKATATRCDAEGNADDFGTYIKVEFNWECDLTLTGIRIDYGLHDGSTSDYVELDITSVGNPASIMIGGEDGSGDEISPDSMYTITITVSDSKDSTPRTINVLSAKFVLDFKSGGKGVAVGKASEKDCFEVGMDTEFYSDAKFLNTVHINDVDLDTYISNKIKNSSVDVKYDISYGTDFPPETGTVGSVYIQYVE